MIVKIKIRLRMKLFVLAIITMCFVSGCSGKTYDEGYEEGYQKGYDSGYQEGYEEGYSKGIESDEHVENEESKIKTHIEDVVFFELHNGYDIGYGDGYALLSYKHFEDAMLKELLWDYIDGYSDGYYERVKEIEEGKEFDYKSVPMIEIESSFIDSVGYSTISDDLIIRMNKNDLYIYILFFFMKRNMKMVIFKLVLLVTPKQFVI